MKMFAATSRFPGVVARQDAEQGICRQKASERGFVLEFDVRFAHFRNLHELIQAKTCAAVRLLCSCLFENGSLEVVVCLEIKSVVVWRYRNAMIAWLLELPTFLSN